MKQSYESPVIRELGTLEHLTRSFNKVGKNSDIYSQLTNGTIIGSVVNPPQ